MREKQKNGCLYGPSLFLFLLVLAGIAHAGETDPQQARNRAFNLDEIVVTGTKTPHSLKDVPVPTVVLNAEDIENASAQTVSDLLRSVPGLFVVSEDVPGVTSWRARIRGLDFNSGYGLVLVNGQRVKGGGMGEYGTGVNQVPLSLIEKIEIIKGPGSVLYGSDALAGVVNIITKGCPEDPLYGTELAAGSEETRTAALYAGGSRGPLGAYFHASRRESGIGAYGYRSSRDESYEENRLNTILCYAAGEKIDTTLRLSVEDQDRTRDYRGQDVLRHEWSTKYRIAPKVDIAVDEASHATLSGYYYGWDMNEMESGADSSGFTPTVGEMIYRDVEGRYTRQFPGFFRLTVGGEFLQEELDYNMADETVETASGYFQAETDFFEKAVAVLGARFDDHSAYGSYLSPAFSLMYSPFSETRVRASAGKGFKSPTIRQLYYTDLYQHGDYWYRSNPDLAAEESWGYSLGVEQGIGNRVLLISRCSETISRTKFCGSIQGNSRTGSPSYPTRIHPRHSARGPSSP
jgi:outer membrane receptor for ferrienterochelin and colicins